MNYNDMVLEFLDSCPDSNRAETDLDLFLDCPLLMRQFTPAQRISIARQYGYMRAIRTGDESTEPVTIVAA